MKDDGDTAFPLVLPPQTNMTLSRTGMSLRDWFAGRALAGILAGESPESGEFESCERRAEFCYNQADAMIKQRNK